MRKVLLLVTLCLLAVGVSYADSGITVNYPSDNTYYCSATNGCGFMGANGGLSVPMWTTGDYITETFVTGQSEVSLLKANWGVVNSYGGAPGTFYENDIYLNGVFIGLFYLGDCDYCGTLMTIGGAAQFAPIVGNGTYTLRIELAQTADPGLGSEQFSTLTANGGASTAFLGTPEPSSIALLGSGILGLAGVLRRRLKA